MRTLFLFAALAATSLGVLAAPQPLVDYDFGASEVVWKPDGSEIALQDAHGIAIRDGRTLALKRYFKVQQDSRSWPRVRAWNGDDLFLEDLEHQDDRGHLVPATATVLNARTGQTRAVWKSVDFSEDECVLWFHRGSRFRVLSLQNWRWFDADLPLRTQGKAGDEWAADITFSPDGRFAADRLADGRTRLWNVKTRSATAILSDKVTSNAYPQVMSPVVWSPDGKLLATLGEDPSHRDIYFEEGPNDGTENEHPPVVLIWDARNGKLVQWFQSLRAPNALWWRDNATLAVGGNSAYSGDEAFEMRRVGAKTSWKVGAKSPVAPLGNRLFAGDCLHQLSANHQTRTVKTLSAPPAPLKSVAWSRDGRFVAASFDTMNANHNAVAGVQIWNAKSFALKHIGQAHSPMRIAWTADNRVWSSDLYRITSWGARDGWAQNEWAAPPIGKPEFPDAPPAHGLFLLPDGQHILQLPDGDSAVYERANRSASPQFLWKDAQSGGFGEVLSPDGNWLSFWENAKNDSNVLELRAYETRLDGRSFTVRHRDLKDAEGDSRWDLAPNFSPDSHYLSWGFQIMKWPSREIVADTSRMAGNMFALSSDAQMMLRVTLEGARLTDRSGRVLQTLSRDASEIQGAAFSFDGKRIALERTHNLEIYDVQTARLLATLYAWPRAEPESAADWLVLRPNPPVMGTAAARALVTSVKQK